MREGVDRDGLQGVVNIQGNESGRSGASAIDGQAVNGGSFRVGVRGGDGSGNADLRACASCKSGLECRPEVVARVRASCPGYEYEPGSEG